MYIMSLCIIDETKWILISNILKHMFFSSRRGRRSGCRGGEDVSTTVGGKRFYAYL